MYVSLLLLFFLIEVKNLLYLKLSDKCATPFTFDPFYITFRITVFTTVLCIV